jgi:Flp pilus assembly CpaE family ATPase
MAARVKNLDIVSSGADTATAIPSAPFAKLMQFVRCNYDSVVVDLAGNLDPHSLEVMQNSERVFLVCTQELDSLHLARRKADALIRAGVGNRLGVVVNRFQASHSLDAARIASMLGVKVDIILPNDYKAAHESIRTGQNIDAKTPLGQAISQFAAKLGVVQAKEDAPSYRYLEHFSLPAMSFLSRLRA